MIEAIEIAEADLTAHLLIEPEEVQRDGLRCIVEVVSNGFVGVNRSVYYDLDDLRRFIADASSLLKTHQGEAVLDTRSPGAARLVIRPLGRGQLQAFASMYKPEIQLEVGGHRMETTFEVDRDSLSDAVIALQNLLKRS